MKSAATFIALFLAAPALVLAQNAKESDYYQITTFETPAETALEVGSIELLPDNKIALGTRRGEIWIASNAYTGAANEVKYQLFASGQHEVLGLAYKDGWLYATNRYEIVRIKDQDGDGRGDIFENVCDQWGLTGDYHEYAFGSRFDKSGDLWVVLCLTGSFTSDADFRGWAVRVKPNGEMVPTCSGIRSPGGIGFGPDGAVYYTDNQGPWHGASTLQYLVPGSFQGHPGGNKWYSKAPNMGQRPPDPIDNNDNRLVKERERIKELVPPVAYMVHGKVGGSSSFIAADPGNGKFGPYKNQIFVGDQGFSNVSRVFVEEVNGVRQSAVFPFISGLKSGIIGGRMTEDGHLLVGGSDRGWNSRGGKPFCFERIDWNGKVPFDVLEMKAKPDGFELVFMEPVDPATAGDPKSYSMREFTYMFRQEYGSPEVDEVLPKITKATVGAGNKSVHLTIEPLTKGHVHELHLDGVRSAQGKPLLHPVAYYTLNEIPKR